MPDLLSGAHTALTVPTVPTAPAATPLKDRRRRRPALACEQCRQRKVRCDRNLPCNTCLRSKGEVCRYSSAPLKPPVPSSSRALQPALPAHVSPIAPVPGPDASDASAALAPRSFGDAPARINGSVAPLFDGPTYVPSTTATATATANNASSTAGASTPDSSSWVVDSLVEKVRRLELQLSQAREKVAPGSSAQSHGSLSHSELEGDQESEDLRETGDGRPSALRGTTAKSRFFGPSHWMNGTELFPHMLNLIRQVESDKSCEMSVAIEKCKGISRAIKASRVPSSFLPVRSDIPDRQLADDLIAKYLDTFETVYRVLHIPSFRADYERYWADPPAASRSFVILMQLCMAIGTSFRDDVASLRAMSTRWIYEAHVWSDAPTREKSRMTIQGLQIMCLLHFARHAGGIGGDMAWVGAGSLLRRAMYCGLHIDPRHMGGVSVLRAEMRRRIWATILEINLQSSIDAGGPPLLSPEDYDTAPPANLDDQDLRDHFEPVDVTRRGDKNFTQTSVQIAIFRSFPQRLAIAKAVNNILPRMPYSELIRVSTELTSAGQALHQELSLFPLDECGKGGVSGFAKGMASMIVHRMFFALHIPLLMTSFQNPAYYFSRKMCIDTALKFCALANLSSPNPRRQVDPSEADFVRLTSTAAGPYGITVFQATLVVAVELMARKEERREQGSTVALGENELRSILEASLDWTERRIRNGETNVKGSTFHTALLAQVDAFDAGLEGAAVQDAITQSTMKQLAMCYEILKDLAGDVSVGEPSVSTVSLPGFGTYEPDPMDTMFQGWEDLPEFLNLGIDGDMDMFFGSAI